MQIIKRKSCRAILLTPDREILLIKIANPKGAWVGWITPGGGLDESESELDGLRRELREELGFKFSDEPARVWRRFHSFPWNDNVIEQHEIFYFFKTTKFDPAAENALTESELLEFKEMRWWALDEIKISKEVFAPGNLYQLLQQLITEGAPAKLLDVGV